MTNETLLTVAKEDLVTAAETVNSKNKNIKHFSAFYTEQAIEKTLKYLLYLSTSNMISGYDIQLMVKQATDLNIWVPNEIKNRAGMLTSWYNATSKNMIIRRDIISKLIKTTLDWHDDLEKHGII